MGSAAKQTQYKKNIENCENLNFLLFWPTFKPLLCQKKSQKKFVVTRVSYTKDNFIVSAIPPFVWKCHGRTFNNLIFNLHERFSIIYKNIHVFDVLFNLQNFASDILKDSKVIFPNVFANFLISMHPGNFSPHYWYGF